MFDKLEILVRTKQREYVTLFSISLLVFIVQIFTLRPIVGIGEPYFIAKNIAAGFGYSYTYPFDTVAQVTCYIPPAYVYFHLLIMKLGGGLIVSQVFGLLCFHAANIVIFRIFKRTTTTGNAVCGFILLSIYLPLWLVVQKAEPDGLNMLLIAVTILLLEKISNTQKKLDVVLLGVLYGIQLLLRPDIIVGMLLFGVWIVFWQKYDYRPIKLYAISMGIGLVMVIPWTYRNYSVFDKFVFVSANAGFNFYMGNNPNATGEFQQHISTQVGKAQVDSLTRFIETHPSHIDADRFLMKLGVDWVVSNPGDAVILMLKKFWYHWWYRESAGSEVAGKQWMIVAYGCASVILVLCGLLGLYTLQDKRLRKLFVTLFVYSTAVSVIFFVQSRHRVLKVDPYLIPLSVIGLSHLKRISPTKGIILQ